MEYPDLFSNMAVKKASRKVFTNLPSAGLPSAPKP